MPATDESMRNAIVAYVERFWGDNDYGPTVREITTAMGWSSTSNTQTHIHKLVASGRLLHTPGLPRTLRVPKT